MIKHLVITRLTYQDKDLLQKRILLLQKILIPALKGQTNKNFELVVMMYDEDVELLKSCIDYPFIHFSDYVDLRKYCTENQINIQTRHDSDDGMSEHYIQFIQSEYAELSQKHSLFLMHFQPTKLDYATRAVMPLPEYHNDFISGFCSICQTEEFNKIVFERSHTKMGSVTTNIYKYPRGFVEYYIHGLNDSLRPLQERLNGHKF